MGRRSRGLKLNTVPIFAALIESVCKTRQSGTAKERTTSVIRAIIRSQLNFNAHCWLDETMILSDRELPSHFYAACTRRFLLRFSDVGAVNQIILSKKLLTTSAREGSPDRSILFGSIKRRCRDIFCQEKRQTFSSLNYPRTRPFFRLVCKEERKTLRVPMAAQSSIHTCKWFRKLTMKFSFFLFSVCLSLFSNPFVVSPSQSKFFVCLLPLGFLVTKMFSLSNGQGKSHLHIKYHKNQYIGMFSVFFSFSTPLLFFTIGKLCKLKCQILWFFTIGNLCCS